MNKHFFFILTTRKYLKLEIEIQVSSISEKQIRLEKLQLDNFVLRSADLYAWTQEQDVQS